MKENSLIAAAILNVLLLCSMLNDSYNNSVNNNLILGEKYIRGTRNTACDATMVVTWFTIENAAFGKKKIVLTEIDAFY